MAMLNNRRVDTIYAMHDIIVYIYIYLYTET